MNLDEDKKSAASGKKTTANTETPKKLSRKEKKALKKEKAKPAQAPGAVSSGDKPLKVTDNAPDTRERPPAGVPPERRREEVDGEMHFEPAPVRTIPPPKYTLWEKLSPSARRKRQIANMESGFREVLGLVHSMRTNQEVLLESFKRLPDAVDSVKKLADHSAQQSELLKAMNDQMGGPGSAGKFTETLSSMDKTTQLLLERAQRSEERLYGMLKHAQRRIALMTVLVLLLFLGALVAVMFTAFPERTRAWFAGVDASSAPVEQSAPTPESEAVVSSPGLNPEPAATLEPELQPNPEPEADLPVPPPENPEAVDVADTVPEPVDAPPASPETDADTADDEEGAEKDASGGKDPPDAPALP